jgi:TonB-dependent SusC/RagA subfamily outer membrane receptor
MLAMNGNYFDHTQTDREGRFYFRGGELPDSTWLVASAEPRRGKASMELLIDPETFPERTLPAAHPTGIDRVRFAQYAGKSELQYTYEHGVRMINLPEVTVSASRIVSKPRKSILYSTPSGMNTLTEEKIDRYASSSIEMLLIQIPNVTAYRDPFGNLIVSIRGMGEPLLVIDDIPRNISLLSVLNVAEIAQIDVLKDGSLAIFGMKAANGVISIHTKRGASNRSVIETFHAKTLLPLGYQQPVEFYEPKYDTPEKQRSQVPDLRTTIHWQPVVQTDSEGIASCEFYTADEMTSYTMIIEGVTDDGRIIRQEEKIQIE